jgi:hypothetical protein
VRAEGWGVVTVRKISSYYKSIVILFSCINCHAMSSHASCHLTFNFCFFILLGSFAHMNWCVSLPLYFSFELDLVFLSISFYLQVWLYIYTQIPFSLFFLSFSSQV